MENQTLSAPTLETLTQEIKYHLHIAAQSVIEVGNRLIIAKDLVPHGQWTDWLNKNFNLKKSSAANFMSVAKRFGGSNFQTSGNFNQSQFVELLKLAPGDEEKFVAAMKSKGTPVDAMSTRELRNAIKKFNDKTLPVNADVDNCADKLKKIMKLTGEILRNENFKEAAQKLFGDSADVTEIAKSLDTLARPVKARIRQQSRELAERANAELIFLDFQLKGVYGDDFN